MLGYVYDRDINKALSGVAGYIKSREKELKLTSSKQLTRASILPDKAIYETRHELMERSFRIYHIFLAV
jgi:predicted HTH domain antitoxin